jgi:3-hydroxyacyl-CoA dehydrogenase/enoyl-CoA hydratase/3-hydroxybutyryl-CoA epimerase
MDRKQLIKLELRNGTGRPGVAIIKLLSNVLNGQLFKQLNDALDDIEHIIKSADDKSSITGVIFTSDKDKIFLAGADLFYLNEIIDTPRLLETVIDIGQETFDRIEQLPVPTVAAIHGACVGGGFELSLACNYRIASNHKSTKIGLPEVTLGVLPAWGGCTRLPEIVNMQTALKVILTGTQYTAKPALKLGLIDQVVHREDLVSTAYDIIEGKQSVIKKSANSYVPVWMIARKAKESVMDKTKGNYPAPLRIIEFMSKHTKTTRKDLFRLEKKEFLSLCRTDEMRNLLRIFLLQEQSKKLKVTTIKHSKIKQAVVIGAGTMGAGITQWLTCRGVNTLLKDIKPEYIARGLKQIGDTYVQGVITHKFDRPSARDGLNRVTTAVKDVPMDNIDIVIEAIIEQLDVKQKVLKNIESNVSKKTIIATNTSALSIDDMAKKLKHPERFVGIHFFNPVYKMKLVEVVRGTKTSDETVQRAVEFVQQIGKLPVVVKDSPGFVVNRILVPYLVKAVQLLTENVQIEQIDKGMVEFGMPMGPFRLMDEIGLDVVHHVASNLSSQLRIDWSSDVELEIVNRINAGHLGKKTAQGFYKYKRGKSIKKRVKKGDELIIDECVAILTDTMVKEAQKVLDEHVIDDDNMLDFAMIMGTGWAPFRGGPLRYAEGSALNAAGEIYC